MNGSRFTGLHRSIIAVAVAISASVVGMVGFQIWLDRQRAVSDAVNDTASLATSLEEHARQIFSATDVLMQGLLTEIDFRPSLGNLNHEKLHEKLKTVVTGSTFIKALAIIDRSGKRIVSADTSDPEPILFNDRPHFFVQEFQDDLGLYIGSPIQGIAGATKDETILPITRRIDASDGRFAGIVYAGMPIGYFLDFYRSIEIQPNVDIRLMLTDGSLLVSHSAHPTGQLDFYWHPLFKTLIAHHAAGTYEGTGFEPFAQEITSYRRVPGFPLVVTVSMNRDKVLAHWRKLAKTDAAFAAIMLLAIAAATIWLLRLTNQREALLRDVTTEKLRAEKAGRDARNADEAKSAFLATMSHEIRTPMNGIIGFSELLLETPLDGRQKEYVTTVHDSARTLLALLNDVLDYSKIEAGKVELESLHFNPRVIAESVLSLFRSQADTKGLALSLAVAPDVPKDVTGDANRLRQILTNLVSNAIKFTEKGSVDLFLSLAGRGGDWAALRFAVKDSGMGISEEARSHLFSRFSQADNSIARRFGGTGLGLAICKSLVDVMRGEIGVSSRLGQGSTFWFTVTLPLATAVVKPRELPMPAKGPGRGVVLVVDDIEINRRLVSVMLTGAGYAVDEVGSGREALARLQKGGIDVVLLDLQMPEMDGFETAARIRTLLGERRQVPIIAMTANAMSGIIEQCMSAGMNGYVRKPATKADLIAAVVGAIGTAPAPEPTEASTTSPTDGRHDSLDESVLDELERHIGRTKTAECAELLFDQIPQALRSLKICIGSNDPNGVEREAHALISPAGSLGLTAVAGIARDIADTVRGGNPSLPELAIRIEFLARACDTGLVRLGHRYPDARQLQRAASA